MWTLSTINTVFKVAQKQFYSLVFSLLLVNPNMRKYVIPALATQSEVKSPVAKSLPPHNSVPKSRQFIPKELRRETIACISRVRRESNSSFPTNLLEVKKMIEDSPIVPDFYHQQFGMDAILRKCPWFSIVRMADLSNVCAQLDAPAEPKLQSKQPPANRVEHYSKETVDFSSMKAVESNADQMQRSQEVDLNIRQLRSDNNNTNLNQMSSIRKHAHLATINIGQGRESELQPLIATGLMRTSSEITLPMKTDFKEEVRSFAHQRRRSMSSIDMIKFFQAQQVPPRKRMVHTIMADRLRQNTQTMPIVSRNQETLSKAMPVDVPQVKLAEIQTTLLSLKKDKVALSSFPFKHTQDVPKSVPLSNLPSSYSEVLGTAQTKRTKKALRGMLARRATIAVQREPARNPFPDLVISGEQMDMEGELHSVVKKDVEDTFEVEHELRKALRKWTLLCFSFSLTACEKTVLFREVCILVHSPLIFSS